MSSLFAGRDSRATGIDFDPASMHSLPTRQRGSHIAMASDTSPATDAVKDSKATSETEIKEERAMNSDWDSDFLLRDGTVLNERSLRRCLGHSIESFEAMNKFWDNECNGNSFHLQGGEDLLGGDLLLNGAAQQLPLNEFRDNECGWDSIRFFQGAGDLLEGDLSSDESAHQLSINEFRNDECNWDPFRPQGRGDLLEGGLLSDRPAHQISAVPTLEDFNTMVEDQDFYESWDSDYDLPDDYFLNGLKIHLPLGQGMDSFEMMKMHGRKEEWESDYIFGEEENSTGLEGDLGYQLREADIVKKNRDGKVDWDLDSILEGQEVRLHLRGGQGVEDCEVAEDDISVSFVHLSGFKIHPRKEAPATNTPTSNATRGQTRAARSGSQSQADLELYLPILSIIHPSSHKRARARSDSESLPRKRGTSSAGIESSQAASDVVNDLMEWA